MTNQGAASGQPTSHIIAAVRVIVFFVLVWLTQIATFALLQIFGLLIASAIGIFAGGAIATTLMLRIYHHGNLNDAGLAWHPAAARHLLTGFVLAAVAAVFTVGLPLLIGKASFVPSPAYPFSPAGILLVSMILLFGAFGEELVFRGYPFQLLAGRYGTYKILLPYSVLFAAAHAANLNVSALALFNTFAWGVLLGYSLQRSGDLWLPTGLHFGWNFTLPLFGVNLSGFTMGLTGYSLEWRASDLWSGGSYGPEASVLTTIVVVALFLAVHRLHLSRQKLPLMPEEDPIE
jgi:membrane protease YdiL (CAAX protease family)